MAKTLFYVLLIVASSATIASSLQCYSCTSEIGPNADKYCKIPTPSPGNDTKVNCTSVNNRCIIWKTVQKDGSVTYFRRDCGEEQSCTNECTRDGKGKNVCTWCCEEDLCNVGDGPDAAEQSGTSRIMKMRGLSALGGFLFWCLL